MIYNIQEAFNTEGYFRIKVSHLGENLFLLEETGEGEIEALVKEARDYIGQWFSDIHPWYPADVDNERLAWMRCYGLPCHAWSIEFFEFVSNFVGVYVCSDDETKVH